MHVDDVITELGAFGRYQRLTFAVLFAWGMWAAMTSLGTIFFAAKVSYHCQIPVRNDSSSELIGLNVTQLKSLALSTGSSCSMYDIDEVGTYYHHNQGNHSRIQLIPNNLSVTGCIYGYEYEPIDYEDTLVSEFDLVCEKTALKSTSKAAVSMGMAIGSLVLGKLGDRFGRKRTLMVCTLIQMVLGLITSASPNIYFYFVFMGLYGVSDGYQIPFTMATELVGRQYRMVTSYGIHIAFSFGIMLTAFVAYFIQEWRYLLVALSLPGLPIATLLYFTDESPRWLLRSGQPKKAKEVLEKMTRVNGKGCLKSDTMENLTISGYEDEKQLGWFESMQILFQDCRRATMTFILWFVWFTCALVYYGLTFSVDNLGGNLYINTLLTAIAEIPGYVVCAALLNRVGRRKSLAVSLILVGLSVTACGLSKEIRWLSVVFYILGKFAICSTFGVIYLLTAEIYPTESRLFAVSSGRTISRAGSILAPYLATLSSIWWPLPMFIMGAVSVAAGFLTVLLPETTGHNLPQTAKEYIQGTQQVKASEDIDIVKLSRH